MASQQKKSQQQSSAQLKQKLSELLKQALGRRATVELLDGYPELRELMEEGYPAPLVAEVLVQKVVRLALDPNKTHQWAVELVFDRIEGKAVQGQAPDDDGRAVEEQLNDVTIRHLNQLAQQHEPAADGGTEQREAEAEPAGSVANPLLDLPTNRSGRSQDV